jgi:cell division protein FtsQ
MQGRNLPLPMDVRAMHFATLALGVCAIAMLVFMALWLVVRHNSFSLRGITVLGDVNYNNAFTLRANVAPSLKGNFFTMDLAQTKTAFEAVPWVRRAVVQRDFPNQLRVTLEEHKSVGYWGSESETKLINRQGEVFDANVGDIEAQDLPRLVGPESMSPTLLAMYQALAPLFKQKDMGIEKLELSGRGSWQVQLDGGAGIELGRGAPAEVISRVRNFLDTYTQAASGLGRPSLESLESADLRHNNAYAIRLRGVGTLDIQAIKK